MKAIKSTSLFSCALVILLPFTINAQEISGNDAQENVFKLGGIDVNSGVIRRFDNRYEGVRGSPFYTDQWSSGTLDLEDGQSTTNVKLKFNQFEDELIIQQAAGSAYYLPKDMIRSFTITGGSGQFQLFVKKNHHQKKGEAQYYRVIVAGEIYLLEYTKVVFEKANYVGGYSNDKNFDEFKKYPAYYYLQKKSTNPLKLKQTSSGVSKVFVGREEQIKTFISENKKDCRKPEDLAQIFSFYNSLQ